MTDTECDQIYRGGRLGQDTGAALIKPVQHGRATPTVTDFQWAPAQAPS
jgi:hypothetical protein